MAESCELDESFEGFSEVGSDVDIDSDIDVSSVGSVSSVSSPDVSDVSDFEDDDNDNNQEWTGQFTNFQVGFLIRCYCLHFFLW